MSAHRGKLACPLASARRFRAGLIASQFAHLTRFGGKCACAELGVEFLKLALSLEAWRLGRWFKGSRSDVVATTYN